MDSGVLLHQAGRALLPIRVGSDFLAREWDWGLDGPDTPPEPPRQDAFGSCVTATLAQ